MEIALLKSPYWRHSTTPLLSRRPPCMHPRVCVRCSHGNPRLPGHRLQMHITDRAWSTRQICVWMRRRT
eukprot:483097-Lingulodinium_polyedra.AAC.1